MDGIKDFDPAVPSTIYSLKNAILLICRYYKGLQKVLQDPDHFDPRKDVVTNLYVDQPNLYVYLIELFCEKIAVGIYSSKMKVHEIYNEGGRNLNLNDIYKYVILVFILSES